MIWHQVITAECRWEQISEKGEIVVNSSQEIFWSKKQVGKKGMNKIVEVDYMENIWNVHIKKQSLGLRSWMPKYSASIL